MKNTFQYILPLIKSDFFKENTGLWQVAYLCFPYQVINPHISYKYNENPTVLDLTTQLYYF